jgi:putative sigma-54 modulation protein
MIKKLHVSITGRHVEVTPALKRYIENRLKRLAKFGESPKSIQVILGVEKYRHIAEIIINLMGGIIQARASTKEMYAAIDQLFDKVERQALKRKDRRERRKNRGKALRDMMRGDEETPAEESLVVNRVALERLSVADAIGQLSHHPYSLIPFIDRATNRWQIVRRTERGGIEIIDPRPSSSC